MAQFVKKNLNGQWIYVKLTDQDEKRIEVAHREKCKRVMQECITDVLNVISEAGFKDQKQMVPNMARALTPALFERRTEHVTSEHLKEIDRQLAAAGY